VEKRKLDNAASLEDCGIRGALCKQKKYIATALFKVIYIFILFQFIYSYLFSFLILIESGNRD
jgi:hypothetical protein